MTRHNTAMTAAVGVSAEEVKEVVYLTTVHAGFPRAIEAAQTLLDLLKEREQQAGGVK
jgi:4-carboxymuconolactone decarboxylase